MPGVEWSRVRAHYAALFARAQASGATQASVAAAGGLPSQSAIAKLLMNHYQGPSVETFLKALKGLGIDPGEFFRQLSDDIDGAPPPEERLATLEAEIASLRVAIVSLQTSLQQLAARPRQTFNLFPRARSRVTPTADASAPSLVDID